MLGRLASILPGLLVPVAFLNAQRPSSWVFQSEPGLSSSQVDQVGKIARIDAGTGVHAFSSKTRTWATLPLTGPRTLRQSNDWLMIDSGATITAFSGTTGRFETIAVSSNRIIVNPTSNRNDVVLAVRDGNTLWTISGLRGGWTSRVVSPSAAILVERNGLIVVDGTSLAGYSATLATWSNTTAAAPPSSLGISHTLAWAIDGGTIHGFSATLGQWSSVSLLQPPTTALANGDVAVFTSGIELVGFSGVNGTFAVANLNTASVIPAVSDHVAYASPDGHQHYLFGAASARWTSYFTPLVTSPTLSGALILLVDPLGIHAYSGLLGTLSSVALANASTTSSTTTAGAIDSAQTDVRLYSAMTGSWYVAPSNTTGVPPEVSRNGALLHDVSNNLWWAFSARRGQFVSHPGGANAVPWIGGSSSIIAVEDDVTLAFFDPRRDAWLTTPISPAERPLDLRFWRTTLVARTASANDLIGTSALHGAIERTPMNGTFLDVRANSEVGVVITNNGVYAFAAYPDLGTEVQFPEFRRMTARGSTVHLQLDGEPHAGHWTIAGFASPTATVVPGIGDLLLDPALLVPLAPGTLDPQGRAEVLLAVPSSPALAGLDLGLQALVVPGAGTAYLSRLTTIFLP